MLDTSQYQNTTIDCSNRKNGCYITCVSENSCSNTNIICPNNGECYIKCKEDSSCLDITIDVENIRGINSTGNNSVIIDCIGNNSCKNGNFNVQNSNYFELNCNQGK